MRLRSIRYLYRVLLHRERSIDPVQLEVKTARIADGLTVSVASPERGCARVTVTARHARSLRAHLRALHSPLNVLLNYRR